MAITVSRYVHKETVQDASSGAAGLSCGLQFRRAGSWMDLVQTGAEKAGPSSQGWSALKKLKHSSHGTHTYLSHDGDTYLFIP